MVLLWESPTKWELAGVQFMTSSVLTITQGVRLEFNNPWVMPVRLGRIVKDPSKTTNGYGATFEVGYEVSDNVALASTGWSDFEGDDASTDEILMPGDTTSGVIHRNVDLHDEDLGRTYWRSPWARSRTSMNRAIIAANAQEAWDFRLWLHRRAGRFRPFWEPSFEDDIRLLDDPDNLIVDSIAIASDSFERYAGDSQTVALAIETDDGWRLVRTLSWERYTTGDKIAVYFAEELNIPVVAIHRVCYLGLKRLDTDRIELRWVGGGVLQTEFTTVELAG